MPNAHATARGLAQGASIENRLRKLGLESGGWPARQEGKDGINVGGNARFLSRQGRALR